MSRIIAALGPRYKAPAETVPLLSRSSPLFYPKRMSGRVTRLSHVLIWFEREARYRNPADAVGI